MKSIILAAFFLAVIITGSLMTIYYITNQTEILLLQLDTLEKQIETKNWTEASTSIKDFKTKWNKVDPIWSMLIDHYEIDYINMYLGELKSFILNKDKINAMAKINSLQILVEHISEKERPSLKNIF